MVSLELKLKIAQEVNGGQYMGWKVHKARKMPHRTVLHYAYIIRKGLSLHSSAGRPPLIDSQAVNEIIEYLRLHPDPNYSEYRMLVITKCKETWYRRHRHADETILPPKVSARAVAIHMKKLKEKAKEN